MSNYFLLSVPSNHPPDASVKKIIDTWSFTLPEFKVGTLDSLMILSDELAKHDALIESIISRVTESLKSLLNNDNDLHSNLVVGDKSVPAYLKSFAWSAMKYRADKPLTELVATILAEVHNMDTLLKTKSLAYAQAKGNLNAIQRKNMGNLSVKSLSDIVKKEYFVLDSEYFVTLLVAVPKQLIQEWLNSYETLTQMVVPRSSQKLVEDEEYALFNVTLFSRVAEEFSNKAREKRFVVRDFKWNADELLNDKKAAQMAVQSEREQWTTLVRLSKANFGELYSCLMHVKCIRIFVESILRYGLPPSFKPFVIKTLPKQETKLLNVLNTAYSYLEGRQGSKETVLIEDTFTHLIEKDYCSVVLFSVPTITSKE